MINIILRFFCMKKAMRMHGLGKNYSAEISLASLGPRI